MKIQKGFSIVELMITLLTISVIIAAFSPVISKKLSSGGLLSDNVVNLTSECEDVVNGDCKLCYLPKGPCVKCNKSCTGTNFLNVDKCECTACNDAENGGIAHCYQCGVNIFSRNLYCKECMPGYSWDMLTKECTPVEIETTSTGGVIWTLANAGDEAGPKFDWGDGTNGTVVRCAVGETCPGGGTIPTCWLGSTSSGCTKNTGYSGCNRVVCNWYAANQICASNSYSLPTVTQFKALRQDPNSNSYYTKQKAFFCNETSYGSLFPLCSSGAGCNSSNDNICHPAYVWGKEASETSAYYFALISDGVLSGPNNSSKTNAYSVRCIAGTMPCPDNCDSCATYEECSACNENYYLNNGECSPCSNTQYCPFGTNTPVACSSQFEHCTQCNADRCTSCENGYDLNQNECMPHVDTINDPNVCGPFSLGCKSCHRSLGEITECINCYKGYTLTNGECVENNYCWTGSAVVSGACSSSGVDLVKINDLYWTKYNAGDPGGPTIPTASVEIFAVDAPQVNYDDHRLVCWQANVSTGTASNWTENATGRGYSGRDRTLCTWRAADAICSNMGSGWDLPSISARESIVTDTDTMYYDAPSLNFCDNSGSSQYGYYEKCGGHEANSVTCNIKFRLLTQTLSYGCIPYGVWTKTTAVTSLSRKVIPLYGGDLSYESGLYGGSYGAYYHVGVGVRCVKSAS